MVVRLENLSLYCLTDRKMAFRADIHVHRTLCYFDLFVHKIGSIYSSFNKFGCFHENGYIHEKFTNLGYFAAFPQNGVHRLQFSQIWVTMNVFLLKIFCIFSRIRVKLIVFHKKRFCRPQFPD